MNSDQKREIAHKLTWVRWWRTPANAKKQRVVNYWRAVALTLKGLRREAAHG